MALPWRTAKALSTLLKQVNDLSPNRSKASDGTIGNAAHAARNSDHNPWIVITENGKKIGIVTGEDITNDSAHGMDSDKLAQALIDSKDNRIKYVISQGTITSGLPGPKPWVRRPYKGVNPHNHHVHISVRQEQTFFDSNRAWDLSGLKVTPTQAGKPTKDPIRPTLSLNATGPSVELLQKLLIDHRFKVSADSTFGPKTEEAVKAFQKSNKILADGVVGQHTWDLLLGT